MDNEDFELLLFDRLNVVRDTIKKYGEDNFYLSFSGGKDSTVLHHLIDMALPDNRIPRVFINTGIEYLDIVRFVKELASQDDRFQIIAPSKPIKKVLETYGYPFKSKEHSEKIGLYQNGSRCKSILKYKEGGLFGCPKALLYQFEDDFPLKLSKDCCTNLKKKPVHGWEMENGRSISIIGIRMGEGGQRKNHKGCAVFDKGGKMKRFKPLNPVSDEWEEWFIKKFDVKLCRLYYPPFNFKRTGCKGCPFAIELQEQLTTMATYLPNEREQCEIIWAPVYKEYRRIGFRLSKNEQDKLF